MIKIHVVSLPLDESLRFLSCLGRDPRSLKTWARHPVSPHPGVTFNCMCKPQEEIMRFLGFVHHPTPGNVSGNEGLAGRLGPQGITIWRELPGASCFPFLRGEAWGAARRPGLPPPWKPFSDLSELSRREEERKGELGSLDWQIPSWSRLQSSLDSSPLKPPLSLKPPTPCSLLRLSCNSLGKKSCTLILALEAPSLETQIWALNVCTADILDSFPSCVVLCLVECWAASLVSKQHTIAALQPPAPSRGEPIVCRLASPAVPRRRGESLLAEDHSPALFSWRVLASPSDSAGQDPRKLSPASSQWPIPDPRENRSILGPSRSRECRQIPSFALILCGHGLPLQIAQLWLGQRVP